MTDKFEGCVVREMRRLDELMKNLHLAAKVCLHLALLLNCLPPKYRYDALPWSFLSAESAAVFTYHGRLIMCHPTVCTRV